MTQPRKEQIHTLRAYWSTYAYTATGGVIFNSLPVGFEAATITQTSGGDTSTPTRGIITSGPGGYVQLRYTTNGFTVYSSGNLPIFGRLTYSIGVYTINFKTLVAGVETNTQLPAGSYSLTFIFPEVMNNGEVPAGANLVSELNGAFIGGVAGGDLIGNYPNPQVNTMTRTTVTVGDGVSPFEFIGPTSPFETNGTAIGVRGPTGGVALGSSPGGEGGIVYLSGGQGGTGFVGFAAGAGGFASIFGGAGGDGSASWNAGNGGGVALQAGDAGADNSGVGAVGGEVLIIAGTGTKATGVAGGIVTIRGGTTSEDGGSAGEVAIFGGDCFFGVGGDGGGIRLTSGSGSSTGKAGNILILTGESFVGNATITIGTSTTGDTIVIGDVGAELFLTAANLQISAMTTWQGNTWPSLPNSGSNRFAIDGSQVALTVSAANLNILTNGSNADALHTHALLNFSGTSGEAIVIGAPVGFENSAGNPRVFNADANDAGNRHFCVGISGNSPGGSGITVTVYSAGERSIADAIWDSVPATTDVGKLAFLSENAGKLTITAPTTSGSYSQRIGFITQGGTGVVKMLLSIGDSFLN